jgi:hypothetical protein
MHESGFPLIVLITRAQQQPDLYIFFFSLRPPPPLRSVTIERYFAIVHPLKHFSAKRFLLLASVVAAVIYNIPKFYEFEKKVSKEMRKGEYSLEIGFR